MDICFAVPGKCLLLNWLYSAFSRSMFSLSVLSHFLPPVLPKIIRLLIAFITDELYFCPQRSMSEGRQGWFHASLFIPIKQLGLGDGFFPPDDL